MRRRVQSFGDFARSVGVDLTPGQRVACRVAYDGVDPADLDPDEREIARAIFGDIAHIPPEARHVFAVVAGARSGKSFVLGAVRGLHLALTVPLTTLGPGEHAAGVVVAPDLRLARVVLRYVRGLMTRIPALARRVESETADGIVLRRPDGAKVEIMCLPATRGGSALRGRSLVFALLDESAFFRDESYAVNDTEILRAVAPRILPGGQLLVLSTPWLEQGVLFDLWRRNFGTPTDALVAHAPTLVMRSDAHTRRFVERERLRDPDNAARELDAEFVGGGASLLFDPTSIARAVDPTRPLASLAPGGAVVGAGGDLALVRNSSTLAIVERVDERYALLEVVEHRPAKGEPLKLSAVVADFAAVLQRHDLQAFVADGHQREAAREWCDAHGLVIESAPEGAAGKWSTYQLLATLLREGRFAMPHHPRLEAQLRAVLSAPAPGGGYRVTSPRRPDGSHGDLVSALVLGVHAASVGVDGDELAWAASATARLNRGGRGFGGGGRWF